jgi:hypothetical protein
VPRKPARVDFTNAVDRYDWYCEALDVLKELRALTADACAPKGQRRRTRSYLRKATSRKLRALGQLIDALSPDDQAA